VEQVNAVPNRPTQTPKEVTYILHTLRGTINREGETLMRKCWNITNRRDSLIRAFGHKQLMGFLPTLARQRAWYPGVYNRQELTECAKCKHANETAEHIYECADHTQVERCFGDRFRALQPPTTTAMDPRELLPWRSLGWLQGRIHPSWETAITLLQHDRRGTRPTAQVIVQLLRAALETWYLAIWLPRCQRTIEQERRLGLHQGAKLRQMRAANRTSDTHTPSPTPKLPRSFIHSILDRRIAYRRHLSRLMLGIPGH
jgi:hypothetical protein